MLVPADPPTWWEQLSWQAATFAALFAAIAALVQGAWALRERRRELRWKQAELARVLMDEWFGREPSNTALVMIDEGNGRYGSKDLGAYDVNAGDVRSALAITGSGDHAHATNSSDKDRFLRICFDALFFQFERAQHSIDIGVVRRKDMEVPTGYYVRRLATFASEVERYLEFSELLRARKFLRSFRGWPSARARAERGTQPVPSPAVRG